MEFCFLNCALLIMLIQCMGYHWNMCWMVICFQKYARISKFVVHCWNANQLLMEGMYLVTEAFDLYSMM